jgi:hypothetical protein
MTGTYARDLDCLGISYPYPSVSGARIAQSAWQLSTGWKVWGLNPGGSDIFALPPPGQEPFLVAALVYNIFTVPPKYVTLPTIRS